MDEARIAQLRMKKDETPEDFKDRFGLTDDEYEKWLKLRKSGLVSGDTTRGGDF